MTLSLYAVFSPYDIASGSPSLSVRYFKPQVSYSGGIAKIIKPATSLVKNKCAFSGNDYIEIVTAADGLKRTIQTKKEQEVDGVRGFIVSGRVVYDELGRVIKQGQPEFKPGYDYGYVPIPLKYESTITYDNRGRKVRVDSPGDINISTSYGIEGGQFVQTVIDPNNKQKTTYKDRYGNIVRVKDHDGNTTSYLYDLMGQITKVIDPEGKMTSIEYDLLGRRTEIDNPDTGKITYNFDNAGNLLSKITPNLREKGQAIRYSYTFSRLDRIVYPESEDVFYSYGKVNAPYNRAGRIEKVTKGSYSREFFYGKLGEVNREIKKIKVSKPTKQINTYDTRYLYDALGRIQQMTYPNGETLHYGYDSGGLLKAVYGVKKGKMYKYVRNITYDKFGQRSSIEYGNGTKSDYSYDEATRRLTNLKTTFEDKTYQNVNYTFDKAGNITKRVNENFVTIDDEEKTSTQEYTYDNLHRLIGSTGNYSKESWMPYFDKRMNTYETSFTYSAGGNILSKTQINKALYEKTGEEVTLPATSYSYDYTYEGNQPHAVTTLKAKSMGSTLKGNWSYEYDKNGNMIKATNAMKPQYRTLNWDEENRLKSVTDFGRTTSFEYDEKGERLIKNGSLGEVVYVSSNYTVRNGKVKGVHVFAGKTRVASKLEMNDQNEENGIYYYHADHLGSSSVVTDKNGKFHEHLEFFPYGETWINDRANNENLPYRFTGKELDPETGLYYYGARYFDARLSRWISRDDRFTDLFGTQTMNLYTYVRNNPVRYIDPDGHMEVEGATISNTDKMEMVNGRACLVKPKTQKKLQAEKKEKNNQISESNITVTTFEKNHDCGSQGKKDIPGGIKLPFDKKYSAQSRITSTWGPRNTGIKGASTFHKGIDIAMPANTPIIAPADGVVIATKTDAKGYGYMLLIDHGDGIVSCYGHVNSFSVKKGDRVSMGDEISKVGNRGIGGYHLHYTIYDNWKSVDPLTMKF